MILPSWQPKKRNCVYEVKPEGIPGWIYTEAVTAKKFYNEDWEFWVFNVAKDYNCPLAEAEDACIRGLKNTINQIKFVYGDAIGEWFERYLDLGDLFNKVKHPEYIEVKLGEIPNDR